MKQITDIREIIQAIQEGECVNENGDILQGTENLKDYENTKFFIKEKSIKEEVEEIIKTGYVRVRIGNSKIAVTRNNGEVVWFDGAEYSYEQIIENLEPISREEFLRIE